MRKRNYKGKCTKVFLSKCPEVCRTYDGIQLAAVKRFRKVESIAEMRPSFHNHSLRLNPDTFMRCSIR